MSQRQRDDMVLLHISGNIIGSALVLIVVPRMTEELKELGFAFGHHRVGRLMRDNGIKVVRTRKYKETTNKQARLRYSSQPAW